MQRAGWILFVVGILYMASIGWVVSWFGVSAFRTLSFEGLQDTMWALNRPLFWIWAFSVPLGAVLAAVGILLHAGKKGSRAGVVAIVLLVVMTIAFFAPGIGHVPVLLGIGGGLILASFIGILWLWGKRYASLPENGRLGAQLQLVGYVLFVCAAWFLCGRLGQPYLASFSDLGPASPIDIMIYLALGWIFLFFGHLKSVGG